MTGRPRTLANGWRSRADLAAQTHEPLLQWTDEFGLLDTGGRESPLLKALRERAGARRPGVAL